MKTSLSSKYMTSGDNLCMANTLSQMQTFGYNEQYSPENVTIALIL